jgi:hypothetical protein
MYDILFFRQTANIIQNLLKKKFFILNLFQHACVKLIEILKLRNSNICAEI